MQSVLIWRIGKASGMSRSLANQNYVWVSQFSNRRRTKIGCNRLARYNLNCQFRNTHHAHAAALPYIAKAVEHVALHGNNGESLVADEETLANIKSLTLKSESDNGEDSEDSQCTIQ